MLQAKISEIQSSQDECTQNDLDSDALTQVKGKDKKGRTRGVGKIPKTKLKANRPLVSELQEVKNDIKQYKVTMGNMESSFNEKISSFNEKMDTILSSVNLLLNQSPQQFPFPFAAPSQSTIPTQVPSSLSHPSQSAPAPAYTGYYHIRNLENTKNIAMGKIEEVTPGTIVHCRPMVAPEVKLSVHSIYPGMQDEPVYLTEQGANTTIGEFFGSYVLWPIYLLEKIM
jgi:hypothetical protein